MDTAIDNVLQPGVVSLRSAHGGNTPATMPSFCDQRVAAKFAKKNCVSWLGLSNLGNRWRVRRRGDPLVPARRLQFVDGVPPQCGWHWRCGVGDRRRHHDPGVDFAHSRWTALRRAPRVVGEGLRGNRERHGVRAVVRHWCSGLVDASRQPCASGIPSLRRHHAHRRNHGYTGHRPGTWRDLRGGRRSAERKSGAHAGRPRRALGQGRDDPGRRPGRSEYGGAVAAHWADS